MARRRRFVRRVGVHLSSLRGSAFDCDEMLVLQPQFLIQIQR
jgi:hypothetical protein